MKIGLLECDHVADKFVAISGTYPEMFAALLPEVEFQLYDVCNGEFPQSVDECDAYTSTGSKFSVYDEIDWILQLKDFVFQLYKNDKKFIGVCFGHQIMAEALGGKVLKSEKGWNVGIHPFEIALKENWMDPFQQNLNLLSSEYTKYRFNATQISFFALGFAIFALLAIIFICAFHEISKRKQKKSSREMLERFKLCVDENI